MRRAYQNHAVGIEKPPRLPVEFHPDVSAAIHVGVHAPFMPDGEGLHILPAKADDEAHAVPAINERAGRADH